MRLLHISDIHYRKRYEFGNEESSYQYIFRNMTPPVELLDRCMALLGHEEKEQLDGILVSGDLTENGAAEDYVQLRKELESRFPGIPIVVTLGNHDDKAAFREGWLKQPPDNSPFCHIVRIGDISILALDNSDPENSDGIIDLQRCAWLQKAAEEEKGRTLILMMHHHLLPDQATFPACEIQEDFPSLLQELPISAILCGHTHQLYRGEYADIPYRTAVSMSFVGQDCGEDVCMREFCGFSLYHIEDGTIISEQHETIKSDKILGYVHF